MLVAKAGTYRGSILDWGVTTTTNGYPQFVVNLQAGEYWDAQEQQWIDIKECDEQIMGYLVLFGGDGKATMTAKQLQKILKWSGQSFQELNDTDYSEVELQFRVEEHEYEGSISLRVNWVDEYDATPGRAVQKLDAEGLKKLDSTWSQHLKQLGGTKVATAKPTTKPTGKPLVPATPSVRVTTKAKQATEEFFDKESAEQAELEEIESLPPAPEIGAPKKTKKPDKCTKLEAWRYVVCLKQEQVPDLTDDDLGEIWTNAITEVAPKNKKGNLTDEQWFEVKEKVAVQLVAF